jgi:NAD+ diphosphatase
VTEPHPDDLCFAVHKLQVLLVGGSGARPLRISEVPGATALVLLGQIDGLAVWGAEASESAALVARDWGWCAKHLDPTLIHFAARAVQVAAFRRTHAFCGACGAPMTDVEGQLARACSGCAQVVWTTPPTVALVAVWRPAPDGSGEREVLLVRHTYQYTQMWALVGGYLDSAESLEEAARREVQEEVGHAVEYLVY